jgi:hypothetical protein
LNSSRVIRLRRILLHELISLLFSDLVVLNALVLQVKLKPVNRVFWKQSILKLVFEYIVVFVMFSFSYLVVGRLIPEAWGLMNPGTCNFRPV